jgi:hypothetical protein
MLKSFGQGFLFRDCAENEQIATMPKEIEETGD